MKVRKIITENVTEDQISKKIDKLRLKPEDTPGVHDVKATLYEFLHNNGLDSPQMKFALNFIGNNIKKVDFDRLKMIVIGLRDAMKDGFLIPNEDGSAGKHINLQTIKSVDVADKIQTQYHEYLAKNIPIAPIQNQKGATIELFIATDNDEPIESSILKAPAAAEQVNKLLSMKPEVHPDGETVAYFWLDLHKSYCDKEQAMMGHCGDTKGGGTLWSLRRIVYSEKLNRYTYPKYPVATLSFRAEDKMLRQVKGRGNISIDAGPNLSIEKDGETISPNMIQEAMLLFIDHYDVQGSNLEYPTGTDWTADSLALPQLLKLWNDKPSLVTLLGLTRLLQSDELDDEEKEELKKRIKLDLLGRKSKNNVKRSGNPVQEYDETGATVVTFVNMTKKDKDKNWGIPPESIPQPEDDEKTLKEKKELENKSDPIDTEFDTVKKYLGAKFGTVEKSVHPYIDGIEGDKNYMLNEYKFTWESIFDIFEKVADKTSGNANQLRSKDFKFTDILLNYGSNGNKLKHLLGKDTYDKIEDLKKEFRKKKDEMELLNPEN